ncbi:hypothetical protein BGW38_001435 [Lunasporangiospora selenospora]|uniref:Uncharacterized protein n=1 Tax=Lunasporangiospora selenospora TaxID=979761 RepID=A0A9P6FTZ1_9FUNG|nr:hypothetical protein BGW38_001435 [Lunasporangiospora selenospora]
MSQPPTFFLANDRIATTIDNLHTEQLGQLLRRTLLRRDYNRAFALYSTLVARTNTSESLWWKIGCEFLRQKKEYEQECLRFLQRTFAGSQACRISILIETVLYQLRFNKIDEARSTLEPYINLYPYNENPLIIGYAGLIEFAVWRRTQRTPHSRTDDAGHHSGNGQDHTVDFLSEGAGDEIENDDEGLSGSQWASVQSRFASLATQLLEQALHLEGSNDMFLLYLVQLKCGLLTLDGSQPVRKVVSVSKKGVIHEMKIYLRRFYNKNSDSLLALHLLVGLETLYGKNAERLQTYRLILKHDPAADSELYFRPLLTLLWQAIPSDQRDIITEIEQHGHLEHQLNENFDMQSLAPRRRDPKAVEECVQSGEWDHLKLIPYQRNSQASLDTDPQHEAVLQVLKRHQPDIAYLHPILHLFLTRAEFGVLTQWEEQELIRTCDLFCFCSLYCMRLSEPEQWSVKPECGSCFDQVPVDKQAPWYPRLARILSRKE